MYRTRLSGHWFGLCGAPEGRVEARGASVERAEVAVLLDQPLGVVAGGEVADGIADLRPMILHRLRPQLGHVPMLRLAPLVTIYPSRDTLSR